MDAHPSREEHLCPALSLSQTQGLESLSLFLLLVNHSTAAHPGSCSKQCPRSNHLLPHCWGEVMQGHGQQNWGQPCCGETPDTSPRLLELGSCNMEEGREGIWESVVELQRSQPKE